MSNIEFQTVTYRYIASNSKAKTKGDAPPAASTTEERFYPHDIADEKQRLGAIEDVSITIEQGEFVAVIGANGSGKTTFVRHINALLTPDSGRVLVAGFDTSDEETLFQVRSHAGMVFQDPNTQIVASVVADDVAFGPENLNVQHDELSARVDQALDVVSMLGFAEADLSTLSGGQRQRVSIAGILAMQPDVLILDEPTSMLDVRGRQAVRQIMSDLNDSGMTIILITHSMEEAVSAKRIIVFDQGRVVLDGTPEQVFSRYRLLLELGLDVPFSLQLSDALAQYGLSVTSSLDADDLKEQLCNWYLTE
ncbi:MAG: energy-coupling factor transporter ATPase [Coriobacteriia bacterium]|nr:energy-coupling factor transporter ATPase [Coriobacteriia bacterium]